MKSQYRVINIIHQQWLFPFNVSKRYYLPSQTPDLYLKLKDFKIIKLATARVYVSLSRGFPPHFFSGIATPMVAAWHHKRRTRSIDLETCRVSWTPARSDSRVLCRPFAIRRALVELESLEAGLEKGGYNIGMKRRIEQSFFQRFKFTQCFPLDPSSERKRLLLQRKANLGDRVFF